MKIPTGAVALRIPIFQAAHAELRDAIEPPWPRWMRDLYELDQAQDEDIDIDAEQTTLPAALGALSEHLHHRLQLIAFVAGGLLREGWELHLDGDALVATRVANPQHALEMLDADGLAGTLCAVAELDSTGWPRLYPGLASSA
ncbi:MAG: hypothetical protein JF887_14600 [Candidatus Dormibacteraeota bacterium]|uniref:Uncharacterized protein n=1 Tax=Candidatus Amunia macphersoniae TaxID=3127014 RepID=A0A934KHD7_9BACT|nr:hypothetical protein [Candidatus Dormibacteraeota bacterium]